MSLARTCCLSCCTWTRRAKRRWLCSLSKTIRGAALLWPLTAAPKHLHVGHKRSMVKARYQQQCSRVCQERGIINQSTHYWKATALLWSKLDRVGLWRFSVGPESSWTAHTVLNSPRIPSGKRRKGIKPLQTRRESIPLALVEDSRTGGGQVSGLVTHGSGS